MNEFEGFEDLHDLPEVGVETQPIQIGHQHTKGIVTDVAVGVAIPGFVEDCHKCGGSGNWRPGYRCFKCKGTGKLQFKTSAKARSKSRKYAQAATTRKAEATAGKFRAWLEEHNMVEWFEANKTSSFAQSLYQGGLKYGHLTESQAKAVYHSIAREEDGQEGFVQWCEAYPGVFDWLTNESKAGNEFAGSVKAAGLRHGSLSDRQLDAVLRNISEGKSTSDAESALDISELKGYYAVPDGDTRLKLCVRKPGKKSRWYGWTFVDDGAEYGSRRTYGKQAPDGNYAGSVQDQLKAILADPFEAQVAYGKLTGTCGVCGRILEDETSVAAGIGPICAAKY